MKKIKKTNCYNLKKNINDNEIFILLNIVLYF